MQVIIFNQPSPEHLKSSISEENNPFESSLIKEKEANVSPETPEMSAKKVEEKKISSPAGIKTLIDLKPSLG